MRSQVLVSGLILLLAAIGCQAGVIDDPFHQDQSTCSFSGSPLCDVIGNEVNYDIQMASVAIVGTTATVSVYLNSGAVYNPGGGLALQMFSDAGLSMIVGDIFFYNPDTVYDPSMASGPTGPAALQYAVPLENHASLTAGSLYSVTSTETAYTAMSGSSDYYRPQETVLTTAGTLASAGSGVTVTNYGNGVTSALYEMTVSFQTTPGFLSLVQNGQIGLVFSAADCANDVIQGAVDTSAPEPESLVLIAGGLGLLLGVRAWRRRASRNAPAA